MADEKKVTNLEDQATFVMSFVDHSREERDGFDEIWDETERNFLVRPFNDTAVGRSTAYPLTTNAFDLEYNWPAGFAFLKDPETHQEVMTIVSKIVLGIFGEPGYIKAKRVGTEDIFKAKTVSKLLEYVDRRPGHFEADVLWVLSACIFGTGVQEDFWNYREEIRLFQSVGLDPITGEELRTEQMLEVPVYDDPRRRCLDIRDFFPDPGAARIDDMEGVAKRFRINAHVARRRVEQGQYTASAVERAIENAVSEDTEERRDKPSNDETFGHRVKKSHPDFVPLVGYEYYGNVPFETKDGVMRRKITVLGGETVSSRPWPFRVPFFEMRITPRPYSFYGIGPAEVIRYDQDFADTLKMMMADAVVRSVHQIPIVDKYAEVDLARLRRNDPGVPVLAAKIDAINYLPYNPPLQHANGMFALQKQSMREASGALGAIQGLGLGTKRFSATEAAGTFDEAKDRPELFGTVIEREFLPMRAHHDLDLFRAFLDDSDDLAARVGESTEPVSLADIHSDFDIEFIGSRIEGSRNQKLAAYREIFQLGANPLASQVIPWIPLIQKYIDEGLGAHEIAAMVGNPELIQLHAMLNSVAAPIPQGGNRGELPRGPEAGLLTAQSVGRQS